MGWAAWCGHLSIFVSSHTRLDGVASLVGECNGHDALVAGLTQSKVQQLRRHLAELALPGVTEAIQTAIDHSNGLLERLLERPPHCHDLPYTLHSTADEVADVVELLHVPSRDLHYEVVQCGLKAVPYHHTAPDLGDDATGVAVRALDEDEVVVVLHIHTPDTQDNTHRGYMA